MIKLNLISQESRKEIKLKRIYDILKSTYLTLLILVTVVSMIFLAARIILQHNFNDVVSQTTLITKNSQEYNAKIREINSKISSINQIQNEYIPWSNALVELAEKSPSDISLTFLEIVQEKNLIKLKGTAETRESLLKLKSNLEDSSIFYQIEMPLSNIFEKSNIYFEIDAKIKQENLKSL
ncbi:MAG: hypothetical protein UT48_C0004G0014 [Parcubacteria group bacterium GW2011_GWE2_39_37]|uniref:Fimbrial assembly family protein n=1 Tax=Candidatus Falkowbacteria bacterium GW2011_GWF2_39_8 TaxID=1618642 RepID=A0A0G0PTG0_9BACT|nr:MAG: hypothetical protein UT48_C0004G0014 [Parcubacteria group bacterium GW2011_GWE2_39_37]KKR31183.1 MAG: hypothetical protein UT64_C0070G0011 [Candidatus Falkowbacteria bacterium GW2011_GWF2_39_8]